MRAPVAVALLLAAGAGCGDDDGPAVDAAVDALVNGCPPLSAPLAAPGDPIDGDTYATFASGFFEAWCVRCHSTTLVGVAERSGAPEGLDWDDEALVRANLSAIRVMVGELNAMPPAAPLPSCDERARLVRWVDAAAP